MEQSAQVENLPFKWGRKKETTGVGKKDADFYESFTYDGSKYYLYDCVSTTTTDSSDFFVGKIINMYEYNDHRPKPRRVELLWFFKPSELSKYLELEGVHDVLENELFLASGTGLGLTNENLLEAISGKCNVLCISKDIRNPRPSDEEIKSADFLFRRTFDVASNKIKEKMDDKIAGVDVKFIFNRTSSEKKAWVVQKVATSVHGAADSLKPNRPLSSDSVRKNDIRSAKELQKISHEGRKDIRSSRDKVIAGEVCSGRKDIRSSRDKVTAGEVYSQKPSFIERKQDLQIPRNYERNEPTAGSEKGLFKKPSSDCKISKNTEEKMLTNVDYRRQYRAFEVTQKPNVEEVKWLRSLSWEESLRDAEGQGNLVLLQNLDPTYTSDEVENIVYSALNEQCTARMIERTSATIPHIGEALVIFKTKDAAKRVIRRLDQGCLLLSNGRILVASSVKVNPPVMPSLRFPGHIKPKAQMRQEMRNAVATSHASQKYTIEFDLALEWCLYRDRNELTLKRVFERQIAEKAKCQIRFRPKHA